MTAKGPSIILHRSLLRLGWALGGCGRRDRLWVSLAGLQGCTKSDLLRQHGDWGLECVLVGCQLLSIRTSRQACGHCADQGGLQGALPCTMHLSLSVIILPCACNGSTYQRISPWRTAFPLRLSKAFWTSAIKEQNQSIFSCLHFVEPNFTIPAGMLEHPQGRHHGVKM